MGRRRARSRLDVPGCRRRIPQVELRLRVDPDDAGAVRRGGCDGGDLRAVELAGSGHRLGIQVGRVRPAGELRVRRVDAAVDKRQRHARPGRGRLVGADGGEEPFLALERVGGAQGGGGPGRCSGADRRGGQEGQSAAHASTVDPFGFWRAGEIRIQLSRSRGQPLLPQAGGWGELPGFSSARPGSWTPGRSHFSGGYAGSNEPHGHRFRRPDALRAAWRRPQGALGHGARGDRDPRRPRARGSRARRGRVRDHGPGASGRRRAGARAPGCGRGRHPDRGPVGHDQQGLRLVDPCGRDRRLDDPRRRRRGRRHRRNGVDVERALHPRARALRLPPR